MKKLSYIIYILFILIIFIPKEKIYYTIESKLSDNKIYFTGEEIDNKYFSIDVNNIGVILDNTKIATIEKINISPFLLINKFEISSISLTEDYKVFFPGKINEFVVTYSLFNPLNIKIEGNGDFGEFDGNYNLIDNKIKVIFPVNSELRKYPLLLSKLHKENEELVYESNF
jgi:hypothetical protein